jgi:hypothetical protein
MSGADHLSGAQFSYRGNHRPDSGGPPLHDLTETGNYMDGTDVYEKPQYFTGTAHPAETFRQIRAVRGKPDAPVSIYRSAPKGVTHIHPGDWVSTSKGYAKSHGSSEDGEAQDWPVLHAQVPASHVRFAGDDLNEHGYFGPKSIPGKNV